MLFLIALTRSFAESGNFIIEDYFVVYIKAFFIYSFVGEAS